MKKNQSIQLICTIALVLIVAGCHKDAVTPPTPTPGYEAATKWADETLFVIKFTPANSPTYASRCLAYIGLTMYETTVNGSTQNRSMAGQLANLDTLPKPETGKTYNWTVAMNAGEAYIIKALYPHAPAAISATVDSLAAAILAGETTGSAQDVLDRSKQYGVAVANAIYNWSTADGGYQGYLHNFSPGITLPTTPGTWSAPLSGQSKSSLPLHPYWGQNRTFVPGDGVLPIPAIIPFSTDPASACYAQFMEVYTKNKSLTQAEQESAAWWGDDPSETAGPPGHSYNLANIVVKKAQPDLFKAAQTFARVGIATADAFINCWKCKYTYFSIRPAAYIRLTVDSTFVQYWPEPPFPAFISGHSTQGNATAAVLTDLYGGSFAFTDDTNAARPKDLTRNVEYKSRSFASFQEAAIECGYSRVLGGIHTRQDNETGLAVGAVIGANVNGLHWLK